MNLQFLNSKPDELRYASLTTFFAFILGFIAYRIPIAAEHIYFFISAPIATFFISFYGWRLTFKSIKNYKTGNVLILGIILTIVSHYLNFVILGLGRLICYHLTGNCADYESALGTLTYNSLLRTFISLYYFGIISLVLFILSGIYVINTTRIKTV